MTRFFSRMKNVCLTALSSALDERNLSKAKEVQIQMTDEFIQCGLDTVVCSKLEYLDISDAMLESVCSVTCY